MMVDTIARFKISEQAQKDNGLNRNPDGARTTILQNFVTYKNEMGLVTFFRKYNQIEMSNS